MRTERPIAKLFWLAALAGLAVVGSILGLYGPPAALAALLVVSLLGVSIWLVLRRRWFTYVMALLVIFSAGIASLHAYHLIFLASFQHIYELTLDLDAMRDRTFAWETMLAHRAARSITSENVSVRSAVDGDRLVLKVDPPRYRNLVRENMKGAAPPGTLFIPPEISGAEDIVFEFNKNRTEDLRRHQLQRPLRELQAVLEQSRINYWIESSASAGSLLLYIDRSLLWLQGVFLAPDAVPPLGLHQFISDKKRIAEAIAYGPPPGFIPPTAQSTAMFQKSPDLVLGNAIARIDYQGGDAVITFVYPDKNALGEYAAKFGNRFAVSCNGEFLSTIPQTRAEAGELRVPLLCVAQNPATGKPSIGFPRIQAQGIFTIRQVR
jgi:hypothetical protein